MTKNQKLTVIAIFIGILTVVFLVVFRISMKELNEGIKTFKIEVISEHNDYHKISTEKSELLYLGEYLRKMESCQGDDSAYGFFVTGWEGVENDDTFFWWVSINGEDSMYGVDEIPLADGDVYTFTHTSMGVW